MVKSGDDFESGQIDPIKFAYLMRSVRVVAEPWRRSAYYADAEYWMNSFWDETSPFKKYFDLLDLTRVVDLATGHGRHAELVARKAKNLIVMDVHQDNITFCKARLTKFSNVHYVVNDGFSFRPIENRSVSSIFCYDAMVHFSPDLVESYLLDAARILKPSGLALFHHSNYSIKSDDHYGKNPHARNYMTQGLFKEFSAKAGLEIYASDVIRWCEYPALDCVTVLQKP